MANHSTLGFSSLHKAKFDIDLLVNRPVSPEGAGDVFYASDTGQLFSTDTAGTSWTEVSGSVSGSTINDLSNVDAGSPTNTQVLTYNSGTGNWEAADTAATVSILNDLGDVNTAGITNGQVLAYNSGTGDFEPTDISTSLAGLTDVTLTSLAGNQFLRYNSVGSQWENITPQLNNLSDVDLTSVLTGNFIKFDGTNWINFIFDANEVPYTPTTAADWSPAPTQAQGALDQLASRVDTLEVGGGVGATTLDGLSDVVITTPSDGQALTYDNGSGNWINSTVSGGGGSYTPSDSSDWNSPAPTTVDGALDDLASDLKSFYFFSNRLASKSVSDTGTTTLDITAPDVVINKNGMWDNTNPTWFLAPEEGFYQWTANIRFDLQLGAFGEWDMWAEFWDGSSATEIGRLSIEHTGENQFSGHSLTVHYYRPAGVAQMFVEFKVTQNLGAPTYNVTYQISSFRVRL